MNVSSGIFSKCLSAEMSGIFKNIAVAATMASGSFIENFRRMSMVIFFIPSLSSMILHSSRNNSSQSDSSVEIFL